MNLTQLEYIVTLADEQKISAAAKKLFVTPAALSQYISKIEAELGTPIFERINRKLHLTYCGEVYVGAARKILEIKKKAYLEIEGIQSQTRGKFVFGCSQNRGLEVFADIYPKFYKKYPQVKVILKEANMNTLYASVIEGAIDITLISPLEKHPLIIHEFLDKEEIVLAIPKAHPLLNLTKQKNYVLNVSDLSLFKDDAWMLSTATSMHRNLTNNLFAQAGFFPKNVLVETSTTDPQVFAVKEGIAVSLIPLSCCINSENMITIQLHPTPYRKLYAGYRKNYRLSEAQKYFIDLIKKYYMNKKARE